MATKNNELSGRAIIICIFVGFLVNIFNFSICFIKQLNLLLFVILLKKTTVLVFLFVKRQIIRFTLKNRRSPHIPIGDEAPKQLKREIDRRLDLVKEIQYEPLLINSEHQFVEFDHRSLGTFFNTNILELF